MVEKEPAFTTTPGFRGEDSRVCYRTYNKGVEDVISATCGESLPKNRDLFSNKIWSTFKAVMRDIDPRLRSICICKRSMQLILNYTDYMFETKGSMQLITWLSIVRQMIKYTFIYPQNLFLQQKDQLSVTSIVTNCTNKTFVSVASMSFW